MAAPSLKGFASNGKTLFLVSMIAGLSMGNESCEKANTGRVLKMEAEVGYFRAQVVTLPSGEVVDFPYVVNTLFYRQVMNNDHFTLTLSNSPAVQSSAGSYNALGKATGGTGAGLPRGVSTRDVKLLKKYGFATASGASSGAGLEPGQVSAKTAEDDANTPACVYNNPLVRLGGEVISFGATWGAGLGIGYNQNGSTTSGGGAGTQVNFSQSKLEIGTRWDDPLRNLPIAIADVASTQEKISLAFTFTPGVPVGISFFYQESIAKVIRNALDKGLGQIVDAYTKKAVGQSNAKWEQAWESRVVHDPKLVDGDTFVAFRGGSYAGVQVGDTFSVRNMHYKWKNDGEPCKVPLDYKQPFPNVVAELEVVQSEDAITVAKVKYLVDERIKPGAQVKLLKLFDPAAQKVATK